MKTWQAGLIGAAGLAAVTTGAFFWTGSASTPSEDAYWDCMADYGFSPDTPADLVNSDDLAAADAVCG